MRALMTFIAGFALIAPPAPAIAGSFMVDVCGEPGVRMAIPIKAPLPAKGIDCCKKGCHAANERKKRSSGDADDPSDSEDCC